VKNFDSARTFRSGPYERNNRYQRFFSELITPFSKCELFGGGDIVFCSDRAPGGIGKGNCVAATLEKI
jgi:hypothetical protein